MPPPPSLSISSSRSRRLAPITESPPDSPGGFARSQVSPLRLSFLSLQRSLHRRPRTTSASSVESATAPAPRDRTRTTSSTITVEPDAYVRLDGEPDPDCQPSSAPAPRNSGTFGVVDAAQTLEGVDERAYVDEQQTPTRETSGSLPGASPIGQSPVDDLVAVEGSPRRSGTFGRLADDAKQTTVLWAPVVQSPTSSALPSPTSHSPSLPPQEARKLASAADGLSPVDVAAPCPPVQTAALRSATSVFSTPAGSALSLPLVESDRTAAVDRGEAAPDSTADLPHVAGNGAAPVSNRLSEGEGTTSSGEDGTHKTGSLGRRVSGGAEMGSPAQGKAKPEQTGQTSGDGDLHSPSPPMLHPRLVASHAAVRALAEALSEEASALEETTARLTRIRRSLDTEIESLFGLGPCLPPLDEDEEDREGNPIDSGTRRSRHSDDPDTVWRQQQRLWLSPSLLDSLRSSATDLVDKATSASKKSAARSTSSCAWTEPVQTRHDAAVPLNLQSPPWLGKSAQGTMLASGVSLPFQHTVPPSPATLALPKKRRSWVKRIFS